MGNLPYPYAIVGTVIAFVLAFLAKFVGDGVIRSTKEPKERYRRYKFLNTAIAVFVVAALVVLWGRLFHNKGTFFGLIGAGLAIALKDPLLSIAGRILIFAGNMYTVGDRIEINKISGDVIDVGFFYTRMMEIGNWITADQAAGRIVQYPNSQIFGTPVYNYTQNFSYIWDQVDLPITYDSNLEAATRIMSDAGNEYTREFLQKAERDLEQMGHSFLVPKFELKPHVYVSFDSNYVTLTMRYIVDPHQRRAAKSFLFEQMLKKIGSRQDIQYGSTTADLTIHGRLEQGDQAPPEQKAA
ncbi:MAG: mechanosensitive ion channel family protein [Terriglobales bacterium]